VKSSIEIILSYSNLSARSCPKTFLDRLREIELTCI